VPSPQTAAALIEGAVVMLFRYLTSNRAPETKALLRAAAAIIIAYSLGVFVLFHFF
jgi:hypothetical protein